MKKILLLLFLTYNVIASATDYYVKNGGNDSASGTSDGTAWETIDKVNSFAFKPGDRILFKRGHTWRITSRYGYLNCKSGTAAGDVVYTSYGTGAKPLFLGSKEENAEGDWTNTTGNLWRNTDASFTISVGNLIFNNEASCATRVTTIGGVTSQGKFYYDASNDMITLYSSSNPAKYYTDIESALFVIVIQVNGTAAYVTIDDLDIRYTGNLGINISSGARNITIKNCSLSYIGGGTKEGDSSRLGNAIQLYGSGSDILIENNFVENIYDSGISSQYYAPSGTVAVSNFVVRNNIISKCDLASFEFTWNVASGTVNGLYFQNNTCINTGSGWAYNQRWAMTTTAGSHLRASTGDKVSYTNCYIRNNIFSKAAHYGMVYQQAWPVTSFTYDYNLYYVTTMASVKGTHYTTFAQWRTYSGEDARSISSDPLFVEGSPSDYSLHSESPAIDKGLNVGYTEDFNGDPIVGNPDIGAFEYQGSVVEPAIPVLQGSAIENATPSRIDMTYNLSLTSKVPAASAFRVNVNSVARTVNSVSISGTKVLLTLASAVVNGDVVTVAYTKPATNPLQTAAGGQAASFTAKSVTNNVNPTTPVYVSSVVENATPSRIDMTYNLTLANIVPAASAFKVNVNSVARSVSSVSISGTKVLLTLASAVVYGDVVTVAYTKPATSPLQTAAGGQAASFTAKSVTNNRAAPSNQSPAVTISSPAKGNAFISPATITIDAVASDADGIITKVEFYNGSTRLGELTAAPYSFTWKNVSDGTYSLTAVATDNKNAKTTSAPVTIVVEKAAAAVNQVPYVSILTPGNNSTITAPATIIFTADASDTDGSVKKVEYFNKSEKIGESLIPPFMFEFKCANECTFDITAVATDNLGATSTSSLITLVVNLRNTYPDLINLYPNPNNGHFTVDLEDLPEEELYNITIVDLAGKAVYNNNPPDQQSTMEFDLSHLTEGTYILIAGNKKIITTKKFIIF